MAQGAKYTMLEEKQDKPSNSSTKDSTISDEDMHLFVYGNIKIVDKETGEILVNKPF